MVNVRTARFLLVIAVALTGAASEAVAGAGCWDLFSVSLLDDYYWNKVNGCSGNLGDELFTPPGPPCGSPIITTTSELGGIVYAFGGEDWNWGEEGTADIEIDQGTYSIIKDSNYVSVILDTATICDADELFPSWGEINSIEVFQSDGMGGWNVLTPGVDFDWILSACDAGSDWSVNGTSTYVDLAVPDFGENNTWWSDGDPDEAQDMAVYGIGAQLPAGQEYRVDFQTDIYTWDSYCQCGIVRIPEPATFSGVMLGALMVLLQRRTR